MFADDTVIDTAEKTDCHEDLQNNLNVTLYKIKYYLNSDRLSLKPFNIYIILLFTHSAEQCPL